MPRTKKSQTKRPWGKTEDLKLQNLFQLRNDRGGVDPTDLQQETIKVVRAQHFPDRTYKNFAVLFRSKARKWNLNNALLNSRRATGEFTTLSLIKFVFILLIKLF